MKEQYYLTSSFTDSRIYLFSFFSYHFSTRRNLLYASIQPTCIMNSNHFLYIPIIHPIRNPAPWPDPWKGTLGRMPVNSNEGPVCVHNAGLCAYSDHEQHLPQTLKLLLLFDPQGHLINMDPFRLIWVQHTFLKLYIKKTLPTHESINL
jgi:hypothetical protein